MMVKQGPHGECSASAESRHDGFKNSRGAVAAELLDRGENNEFACSAQHPPAEPDRKRPVRPPPRTGRRLSRASDALLSRAGINSFAATHKEPKRCRCDEV